MVLSNPTPAAPVYLKNYKPPSHAIPKIDLTFDIFDNHTQVINVSEFNQLEDENTLCLNGESAILGKGLKLIAIKLNDKPLSPSAYKLTSKCLILENLPPTFTLTTICHIFPHENHALEGLYKSGDIYCTQNEPEGFRKITYHLDRPDVMSSYTTTIIGDKKNSPYYCRMATPSPKKN